jgi:hypothetical protein
MIPRTKHLRALMLGAMMSAGLVTVTLAPRVALAQTSKGTLTGIVRDSSGAVVVGANVTATDSANGEIRSTATTTLGAYRLDALTPGQYTLHVESTGFEQFEAKNVTVSASLVVSYDVELKLGHLSETVSVNASNILLNQENGSLSQTISGAALAKLPIFSLNPIELLTTVPGVQIVSNTNDTNGEEIQVSGARSRANNFMIDGEEINDATIAGQAVQPNIPDMYSDVIVYTHNPPAEFGRASGGVVNLITKGGTNTFHGSGWELYSGSGLNSTDGQQRQLTPKSRGDKPRYDQHQLGFTAGGPIIKDKLFAFGAAQWTRVYGNETALQVLLPNASGVALLKELAGGTGTVATNAALMLQYLSNASYLSSFADFTDDTQLPGSANGPALASLGTACSSTDSACNAGLQIDTFLRPATPEQNPDTQWTYRIDYTPWTKDTFTARYLHDRSSLTPDFFANGSSLPGFDTLQGGFSELGQGTWTHIFSSHFLNEFRASETRLSFAFSPTAQSVANPLYDFPTIETPEIQNLGFDQTDFPQGRGQDMYQFQDTVSWTHGRHTVRAGADIGRRIEKDLNAIPVNGVLSFAKGGDGSSGVGDFLLNELGPSGTATRTFGNPDVDPHSWRSGIFAQDDFKFSPGLTLNLGVRWDYYTNPDNSLPYPAINPSLTPPFGPINTVYKVAEDKTNFAPRVGFAYTPRQGKWLGDGKTVVRGGFGIFYDPEFTNITTNNADTAPNVAAGEIQQTATGPVIGNATGLLATISPEVNQFSTVESVVNNLTSPYSEEWNLGVERVLPGQIALSVTYVGSRGVKLFANQQYNYQDFNTGARLDPTRGAIIARGNFADSRYNGLEVGGKHNFSHGLAVTGSYVYSKSLDDGSDIFAPDSSPTSYSANLAPGGRHQDWGNSVFDHRQYAAFTYVWSPTGLHSDNKRLDAFLSGGTQHWTISGASRFQSGAYANLNIYGEDTNGDGSVANDRPILSNKSAPIDSVAIDGHYSSFLGGPATPGTYYDVLANNTTGAINPIDPTTVHWLIPYGPQFVSQEVGRNSFLTPGSMYNDIALEKAIPTSLLHLDRGQFVIRAEVENVANHNNLNYPWLSSNDNYTNLDLLYAGTSTFLNRSGARDNTDAAGNRSLRFWAKFTF